MLINNSEYLEIVCKNDTCKFNTLLSNNGCSILVEIPFKKKCDFYEKFEEAVVCENADCVFRTVDETNHCSALNRIPLNKCSFFKTKEDIQKIDEYYKKRAKNDVGFKASCEVCGMKFKD